MSTVCNQKPLSQRSVKRAFFFTMTYYCLKSPTPLLHDHRQAKLYRSWRPWLTRIGINGAFTQRVIDRKTKIDMIETP